MTESQIYKSLHAYFPFGFQVSRRMWHWLDIPAIIDQAETPAGKADIYRLRQLADRYNVKRYQSSHVFEPIQAGQLVSVGIIVDILRYVADLYCFKENQGALLKGLEITGARKGTALVDQPPPAFVEFFPPPTVLKNVATEQEFLKSSSPIATNREAAVAEMILLSLAMGNPAFAPYRELFDDIDLKRKVPYLPLVQGLEEFFETQPVFSYVGMTLFQCLRAPILASPDSLEGQLNYIRQHWARFLPAELLERLLLAVDLLKEERQLRGYGPGPIQELRFGRYAYGYDLGYPEPAAFSQDADWMSNVVIIAKTVYVWLDQLSKIYQREIKLLSDVPDEELDRLARWGFTGLWLIGLWERSASSQKIKQIMGNPEAAPSAYSLFDYIIAGDLGGEEAFQNLRERAWRRGIRLASDMVPNHMGIFSRWVIEHPDWFVQLDYPPFPCYQFNGPDLSWDSRVGLFIEDGYWDHRDAAVVFKRVDRWTGTVKYIYHGNDGTSTPWNDTAQLNFMLPEVREAVIQLILHVARKFPIIRFDAAMTLAKKHYHRLWFPPHGEGGAIPSRAEHGLNKAAFDAAMPKEFWREVVDRVTAEVPDTLLLAEAFWLMEGYFVRTLGMHRVYNSAFMNMLKMEENNKYRITVKNVLEFSPEVLKRFVNFMNNPDERTAVDQFGRGDKYFGVAMMMVTMPGLPMFGHGQIEGFTEKYGMEYRKAYWDEKPDEEMIRRHERETFPIMRHRRLFSGAANFAMYDFNSPEGWVDENVFAYSNRFGDERALILYNNAYNTTRGSVRLSTAINVGSVETPNLIRKTLAEALELKTGDNIFYTFRDYQSGLEYIREARQMAADGIFAELKGYQYHAFLDFRDVYDSDGSWRNMTQRLSGGGVPNIEEAYQELKLEPIIGPFRAFIKAELTRVSKDGQSETGESRKAQLNAFCGGIQQLTGWRIDCDAVSRDIEADLEMVTSSAEKAKSKTRKEAAGPVAVETGLSLPVMTAWAVGRHLGQFGELSDSKTPAQVAADRVEKWRLAKVMAQEFRPFVSDDQAAWQDAVLAHLLIKYEHLLLSVRDKMLGAEIQNLFADPTVQQFLQVNSFNNVLWFSKERFEKIIFALSNITGIRELVSGKGDQNNKTVRERAVQLVTAAEKAGYQVSALLQLFPHDSAESESDSE